MNARDEILSNIRQSINLRENDQQTNLDYAIDVFHSINTSLTEKFIQEIEAVNGQVFICNNTNDLSIKLSEFIISEKLEKLFCIDKSLQKFLNEENISYTSQEENFEQMEAGITYCELLIAQTGSIIISSAQASGRRMNIFPPTHIVLANKSQITKDLESGIKLITNKYCNDLPSLISTITGQSRTADIEKTLILGAHGPKELIVFIDNSI